QLRRGRCEAIVGGRSPYHSFSVALVVTFMVAGTISMRRMKTLDSIRPWSLNGVFVCVKSTARLPFTRIDAAVGGAPSGRRSENSCLTTTCRPEALALAEPTPDPGRRRGVLRRGTRTTRTALQSVAVEIRSWLKINALRGRGEVSLTNRGRGRQVDCAANTGRRDAEGHVIDKLALVGQTCRTKKEAVRGRQGA